MIFSLKRIFHNIKRHLGVYLIFILCFAIGVSVLVGTVNVQLSLKDDLKAEQEKMAEEKIGVYASAKGGPQSFEEEERKPWEERINITYETYLLLEKIYGDDLKLFYFLQNDFGDWIWTSDGKDYTCIDSVFIRVLYVNNAFFENLFGVPMEPGKVYAGKEAYDSLVRYKNYHANPQYIYDIPSYPNMVSVENGEICFNGKPVTFADLPPCEEEYITLNIPKPYTSLDFETFPQISNSVFLPLEEFADYAELLRREYDQFAHEPDEPKPFFVTDLSFEYKSTNIDVNTVPGMLDYLMSQKTNCEFRIEESLLELQRKADSIEQTILLLMTISSFMLLIVVLGSIGLLQIYLYRRKKQMAVSIAYGSTAARLFGEIFAEILLITGTGAALGLCALRFLMPYAAKIYSQAAFHPVCILIAFAIALISALLTTALSVTGLGKISPAKILKNL